MNAYAKIAIKIAIVIVICFVVIVGYNALYHARFMTQAENKRGEIAIAIQIEQKLDSLLEYDDILPQIRHVQLKDIETIRNLIPDAEDFKLTSYLRRIHHMISDNHLETGGIVIRGTAAPLGGVDFEVAFAQDPMRLVADLESFTGALKEFETHMDEMNNLLISYQFYFKISSGAENFVAIAGGIETHTFNLSVRGSYEDIKRFTFEIFNMRPTTALTDFQMSPQGAGFGPTRQYSASFKLITYGDANSPPPLWKYYRTGLIGYGIVPEEDVNTGDAVKENNGSEGENQNEEEAEA